MYCTPGHSKKKMWTQYSHHHNDSVVKLCYHHNLQIIITPSNNDWLEDHSIVILSKFPKSIKYLWHYFHWWILVQVRQTGRERERAKARVKGWIATERSCSKWTDLMNKSNTNRSYFTFYRTSPHGAKASILNDARWLFFMVSIFTAAIYLMDLFLFLSSIIYFAWEYRNTFCTLHTRIAWLTLTTTWRSTARQRYKNISTGSMQKWRNKQFS